MLFIVYKDLTDVTDKQYKPKDFLYIVTAINVRYAVCYLTYRKAHLIALTESLCFDSPTRLKYETKTMIVRFPS